MSDALRATPDPQDAEPTAKGPKLTVLSGSASHDRILANCSQELRGPLTPIMGWAGVFRQRSSFKTEEVQRFAQTVFDHSKRLEKTISSLLHSAALQREGTQVTSNPVEVETLLRAAAEKVTRSGRSPQIDVEDGAAAIEGDIDYLAEALDKVVDNAIKFSPEDSTVELTATRRGEHVVVAVTDRGPGIDPDRREAVFNCFERADDGPSFQEGLGLGLFIAREIVRGHGGQMWIEGVSPHGTRLVMALPAAGSDIDVTHNELDLRIDHGGWTELPEPDQASRDPKTNEPLKILVVDDEEDVLHMVKLVLHKQGYDADTAISVVEARSKLESSDYAVMICDVRMKGELALNLLRDVGQTYSDTVVLMLTAVDDPKFARAAIDLGAFAYIVKPFKPNDLLINVWAAFHHRQNAIAERAHRKLLQEQVEERTRALAKTARQYQEVVSRSLTDELTGLRNYRHFKTELESELHRAVRYNHPLSLLIFDIDYFKNINDRYGHIRGDVVLAELAARVAPLIRPHTDTLARYGGEEFAVILPHASKEGACAVAERIRQEVANKPFVSEVDDELWVTVSVGVASYPDDAVTPEALFRAADWAMFAAKARGRDRVWSGQDPDEDKLVVEDEPGR